MLIDDFGTGYSSLSYLHRFSVNTLKIDRSFVDALAGADENVEIIRTIITLARALGMTVIAEGVETEDQHRRLMALECEEVQGFSCFPRRWTRAPPRNSSCSPGVALRSDGWVRLPWCIKGQSCPSIPAFICQ